MNAADRDRFPALERPLGGILSSFLATELGDIIQLRRMFYRRARQKEQKARDRDGVQQPGMKLRPVVQLDSPPGKRSFSLILLCCITWPVHGLRFSRLELGELDTMRFRIHMDIHKQPAMRAAAAAAALPSGAGRQSSSSTTLSCAQLDACVRACVDLVGVFIHIALGTALLVPLLSSSFGSFPRWT